MTDSGSFAASHSDGGDSSARAPRTDDLTLALRSVPTNNRGSIRYIRARRPFRRLATGGVVVAGIRSESYLLEPGAEVIWEILDEPKRFEEVMTELETIRREAVAFVVGEAPRTSAARLVGERTGVPDGATLTASPAAVRALLDELHHNGVVDVL